MVNDLKRPHTELQAGSSHIPPSNTLRRPRMEEGESSARTNVHVMNNATAMPNYATAMPTPTFMVHDTASFDSYMQAYKPLEPKLKGVDKQWYLETHATRTTRPPSSLHSCLGDMENGRVETRCGIASRSLSKDPQRVQLSIESTPTLNKHFLATDESVYPFYHPVSRIFYLCGYPSGECLHQVPLNPPICNIIHTENATVMCRYHKYISAAKYYIFHNNPECVYHHYGHRRLRFCMEVFHSAGDPVENTFIKCHKHVGSHFLHQSDDSFSFAIAHNSFLGPTLNPSSCTKIDTLTLDGEMIQEVESRFALPQSDISVIGQNNKNVHVGLRSGYLSVAHSSNKSQWSAHPLAKNHSVCDIQAPRSSDSNTFICSYIGNGPKNLVLWDTRVSGRRGPAMSFHGYRNSHRSQKMHTSEEFGIVASGTDEGIVRLWDCRKSGTFMDSIDMRWELGVGERLTKVRFERGRDYVHKGLWIETSHSVFLSRI